MPKYKKVNGESVPNEVFIKTWVQIPIESDQAPNMWTSYLVPPLVADYIELLESKINGDLPKLTIKNNDII